MNSSSENQGNQKYDLSNPLPESLEEVERQIEYWMSRQNEGEAGSNWEYSVGNKLKQLGWKQQQLLRSSAVAERQAVD